MTKRYRSRRIRPDVERLGTRALLALAPGPAAPADGGVIVGQVTEFAPPDDQFAGRPDQLVYLDLKGDGTLDPGDPTAVTDSNGMYSFTGVAPGLYTLRLVLLPGIRITSSAGDSLRVAAVAGQVSTSSGFFVAQDSLLAPLSSAPSLFGTNPPDVRTAEATAYYYAFLGRAPDAFGLANAVAYLKAGGSLEGLARGFQGSAEYETRVVAGFYWAYLGRPGSTAEVAGWVRAMQGGLAAEQVAADFLTSAEFDAGHPDDASFVRSLYEDTLAREPSAAELSAWDSALAGGVARAQAVHDLVVSTEALEVALANAYNLFDAVVDGAGFDPTPDLIAIQLGTATLAQGVAQVASLPVFVERADAAFA